MNWIHKIYNQLSLDELYQILQLRAEVFVVEQNCPFNDLDGKDRYCQHLMCYLEDGQLLAYTRIVPPKISYPEPSIGRVITALSARKMKLGKNLMERSIQLLENTYGSQAIRIGAQLYLKKFYQSFGFEQASDVYLEDGIEHILMVRAAQTSIT
jgi:ElaA protein